MREIKKGMFHGLLAALLVGAGVLIGWNAIRVEETSVVVHKDTVTRGEVLKAIALALTDKEQCLATKNQYFAKEESNGWYVPYLNYLYEKGIIKTDTIAPVQYAIEQKMDTMELKSILYRLNMVEVADQYLQAEDGQAVSDTLWWAIYEELLAFYDRGEAVQKQVIKVCGTIANLDGVQPWQVYTNKGIMGFDGLALDYYIDSEVEVLHREGELIRVTRLLNRNITYENVWIMENKAEEIQVFLYGIVRSFSMDVGNREVNFKETIGDITLQNGTVVQVREKEEKIREKVLAISQDHIVLEHSGTIPLSESFQAYQLYQGMERKGMEDIIVGSSQEFIIDKQEICGAILWNPMEVTKIRVLLMTTGYTSYYHEGVQIVAQEDILVTKGNEITWYKAGTTLHFTKEQLADTHIVLQSDGEIGISSIARSQGTPYYSGTLELTWTEQGILIVNELPLEQYLLKVVPSEMPARYGVETAKIQAICARSFAIGQIAKNACHQYGAHVDDSTTYQVYNNIPTQENSTKGVQETEGLVLTSEGTVISAWYYSTSCGMGTDNRSWGSATVASYIQGQKIGKMGQDISFSDLQKEEIFQQWIRNWDAQAYEADMPWFRWKYEISMKQLQEELQNTLPSVIVSYGKYVFSVDEMGNEKRAEHANFGTLLAIEVKTRGTGGIVEELVLYGTEQTILVRYQTAIRRLMGMVGRTYANQSSTGTSVVNNSLLPSAFFCLLPITEGEQIIGYGVYGGGNGHGIGMSQNGAKAMCDLGMTAEEVLQFFYPGAKIQTMYSSEK